MSDLREILLLIQIHDLRHPDHGVNCACMDRWIIKIRSMTTMGNHRAQHRVDYVLRMVTENRPVTAEVEASE